ncbi:ribonucleases P/MRP protein subunit pop7 [Rhizophlyctis rosea]|nr:ribonucleases P/MRP protein subunit pop7 [Rhizophlyctis rosea]
MSPHKQPSTTLQARAPQHSKRKPFQAPTTTTDGIPGLDRKRHKRAPQRPPTLETDIYVSKKSNFAGYASRAQKLLDRKDITHLTIHGLGAAITRAINLALYLKEKNPDAFSWTITTSSVKLYDDVEPEDVDDDLTTDVRTNSAIHIKIVKASLIDGGKSKGEMRRIVDVVDEEKDPKRVRLGEATTK